MEVSPKLYRSPDSNNSTSGGNKESKKEYSPLTLLPESSKVTLEKFHLQESKYAYSSIDFLKAKEKEIGRENILYHNAFNIELKDGLGINFFAPKSEKTLERNKSLNQFSKEIAQIRDHAFFLTKEDESIRGNDLIYFDLGKLLKYKFNVYESNNEAADQFDWTTYVKLFKNINSQNEMLHYTSEWKNSYPEDPNATMSEGKIIYNPYCPEYLITAPTNIDIIESIKNNQELWTTLLTKYSFDYSDDYSEILIKTLDGTFKFRYDQIKIGANPSYPTDQDLIYLDDGEDYGRLDPEITRSFLVSCLFNYAVIGVKDKFS